MFLPTMAMSGLVMAANSSSAAEPAASCKPEGTALAIAANDNKFDKNCLAAPANQAFTIDFDNQDRGFPHNVSIYDKNNGNKALYTGEVTQGPTKTTYSVPPVAAGTYEFRCDPHPEIMLGTFISG
jgi:plastocyanin